MILLGLIFLAAVAHGQLNNKCIHNNIEQRRSDVVIDAILKDLDTNNDTYVTDIELLIEFVGRFDTNADSQITRQEFVPKWHQLYKDVPDFADYMFDHFDQNNDGLLGLYDVPRLKTLVDIDLDGRVSDAEFSLYMIHLYEDCVPHTHKMNPTV